MNRKREDQCFQIWFGEKGDAKNGSRDLGEKLCVKDLKQVTLAESAQLVREELEAEHQ